MVEIGQKTSMFLEGSTDLQSLSKQFVIFCDVYLCLFMYIQLLVGTYEVFLFIST